MEHMNPGQHTVGAVFEVVFDHDAGTMSFILNGGAPHLALGGFPKGAAMRPYVQCCPGDQVSLVRPFLE